MRAPRNNVVRLTNTSEISLKLRSHAVLRREPSLKFRCKSVGFIRMKI